MAHGFFPANCRRFEGIMLKSGAVVMKMASTNEIRNINKKAFVLLLNRSAHVHENSVLALNRTSLATYTQVFLNTREVLVIKPGKLF
jgi:hypothetical protein